MILKTCLFLAIFLNAVTSYAEIYKYYDNDGIVTYSNQDVDINSDEFQNATQVQAKEYFDLNNRPMLGWIFKDGEFIRTGKIIKKEKLTFESAEQAYKRAEELAAKELVEKNNKIKLFRKKLQIGDYSNRGLVVEIKRPLANVQTNNGLKWYRVDNLYPLE